MKPIFKWTIGETNKNGYECLIMSIFSFKKFFDIEVFICHNCLKNKIPNELNQFHLLDQSKYKNDIPKPKGVAWKLYPPRIDENNHEVSIDNDIVITKKINQIELFLKSNCTLMLEDTSRAYGRFDKHIPANLKINSGIYGMPPNFELKKFIKFYSGEEWQKNALNQYNASETFDEQGIIALALLSNSRYIIIPNTIITNCENDLIEGDGFHFIGLNRKKFHRPFRLFKSLNKKLFM